MSATDRARMSDVKVGAFVLAALAILVVGSLWIAGSAIIGSPRVDYRVRMKDAGGLQTGDRVRVSGVSVGRVEAVELHPGEDWPVVLSIHVKRSVQIKTDAEATPGTAGLLGASYLEIRIGSATAPPLAAGGEIYGVAPVGIEQALARVDQIAVKATGLLDQLSGIFDTVSAEIAPILQSLNQVLSEENAANLQQMLADLRHTTREVGPRLTTLLERADGLLHGLENGTAELPELTAELEALVADLRAAIGPGGERLSGVLDKAESSLGRAGDALGAVGNNRDEIDAAIRDLSATLANLKAFSQQVKEHPYRLVRIKNVPDREPGSGVSGGPR